MFAFWRDFKYIFWWIILSLFCWKTTSQSFLLVIFVTSYFALIPGFSCLRATAQISQITFQFNCIFLKNVYYPASLSVHFKKPFGLFIIFPFLKASIVFKKSFKRKFREFQPSLESDRPSRSLPLRFQERFFSPESVAEVRCLIVWSEIKLQFRLYNRENTPLCISFIICLSFSRLVDSVHNLIKKFIVCFL